MIMDINKIYNENCLDTMRRMPDNFVDLTVTSPPYDNLREYKGYSFDFEAIAKELYRVTKVGGVVVWVVGDATVNGSETGTSFRQALFFKECGFNLHDTMIYNPNKIPLNHNRYEQSFEFMFILSKCNVKSFNPILVKCTHFGKSIMATFRHTGKETMPAHNQIPIKKTKIKCNIWSYQVGNGKSTVDNISFEHPATFPEQLAADHIYSWSNEGDLVYDPFTGSGTTLKMAHLQKRKWIGSEISSEYTELANKRIAPYLTVQQLF